MQHDLWFDLQNAQSPKKAATTKWQGKVRLIIQFVYSKVTMVTGYVQLYDQQLQMDIAELKDLRMVLKHMESPFGFIKGFQLERKAKDVAEVKKAEFEEKKDEMMTWELSPELQERLDKLEVKEKEIEKKVD